MAIHANNYRIDNLLDDTRRGGVPRFEADQQLVTTAGSSTNNQLPVTMTMAMNSAFGNGIGEVHPWYHAHAVNNMAVPVTPTQSGDANATLQQFVQWLKVAQQPATIGGVGHQVSMATEVSDMQASLPATIGNANFSTSAVTAPGNQFAHSRQLLPTASQLPTMPWLLYQYQQIALQQAYQNGGGAGFLATLNDPSTFLLMANSRRPKRVRTAFSPTQLLRLEEAFDKNPYLVGLERKELAATLNLKETQVKVWFQNRRTKKKRTKQEELESTYVDGETLEQSASPLPASSSSLSSADSTASSTPLRPSN